MKKSVKKIWDILSTLLVAVAVILALLLVGARLVGLKVYTVLSGSMEPTYHTGSLIYVKPVETDTLKSGDVITFMLSQETIATHRIVDVYPDEEEAGIVRFSTKGDANDAVDGGLVHCKNVIGTPIFTIPYLGYVASYIQAPPGMYVAIAAGVLLILLVFLPGMMEDEKEAPKKSKKSKKAVQTPKAADEEQAVGAEEAVLEEAEVPPEDKA